MVTGELRNVVESRLADGMSKSRNHVEAANHVNVMNHDASPVLATQNIGRKASQPEPPTPDLTPAHDTQQQPRFFLCSATPSSSGQVFRTE
jgi:hypothetical protein